MTKYHVRPDGTAGICKSQKGKCPYGDSSHHFDSLEECNQYSDGLHADLSDLSNISNWSKPYIKGAIEEAGRQHEEFIKENKKQYDKYLNTRKKLTDYQDELKYKSFESSEILYNSLDDGTILEETRMDIDSNFVGYHVTDNSYKNASESDRKIINRNLNKYNDQIYNMNREYNCINKALEGDFSDAKNIKDEEAAKSLKNLESYSDLIEKDSKYRKTKEELELSLEKELTKQKSHVKIDLNDGVSVQAYSSARDIREDGNLLAFGRYSEVWEVDDKYYKTFRNNNDDFVELEEYEADEEISNIAEEE